LDDTEDELFPLYQSYWFFIFFATLLVGEDLEVVNLFDECDVSRRIRLGSLVLLG
jgi:hypothetical protein